MVYANPFEFMGYVKAADYVVTSQFHGVMFSLIFNKKFVIFSQGKGKVIDAIEKFELKEREVTDKENLLEILQQEMDYLKINKNIREESLSWLQKALETACDANN